MTSGKAVIIGAGPAGLTAALELLRKSDIKPVLFEATESIGGISRTVNHKGNRIDIGGHRFFSKSDSVMAWWRDIMPLQTRDFDAARSANLECLLIRDRFSHILYTGKLFDYPVSLNKTTILNLGLWNMTKIGFSYLAAKVSQRKEKSLEDFMINRFGKELYRTFFRDYTEKVWGVPCHQISAEWGAQRIKGLSILAILKNALWPKKKSVDQKDTETSLITQFLYPPLGPGQLWEKVADLVRQKGGEIHFNKKVVEIRTDGNKVSSILVEDAKTRQTETVTGDYFFSTMPIRDLVQAWRGDIPDSAKEVGLGLQYRDFVTVGLLLKRIRKPELKDNWIYVQEPQVKVGRLQIFNNWSPFLVRDPGTVWIGLEYFCNEGDPLWSKDDATMADFAVGELEQIGMAFKDDVLDHVVIRVPKTYPAYFGTYARIHEIRDFVDRFGNLFLVGRNGMHRYNNMDHSMLTAMAAVDNILSGSKTKSNLWEINAEQEYHERKNTKA